MLVAICDDERKDREKIGGILGEKMRKREEPLQITYFEKGEDLMQKITQIIEENLEMEKMDIAFIADKMCMGIAQISNTAEAPRDFA